MRCHLPDAEKLRNGPPGRLRLRESQELCHRSNLAQGFDMTVDLAPAVHKRDSTGLIFEQHYWMLIGLIA
jgi:hypothetical protein